MIRQLPPTVRSRIRSGVAITSVTQCVEELLLNAVDANSRCVAVRIDLSCFRIQVIDNGTGIAADQLDKIGQRYSTSKCQTVDDLESLGQFGYRGEALSSICDVSYILEVTSRARCSAQTYCKIFQQGKSLDTVESKVHRPSPGTTITVHNLFYNLPVRQKSISVTLEMENICHRVEALALMQPALSLTLRNDTTGSVLLQTHKTNSPLVTFSYLFNHSKTQSLVSVSNSVGHFCIKGYIGKESHYRKDLQFIYVNKRLVLKTQLHKLVNRLLKKSLIVRQHQSLDTGEKLSPSKQADKYPIFVLNIQCPLNTYDITFDPRKTMVEFVDWDTLNAGVEEMCKEFLCKENLLTIDCLFSEERNENNNLSEEVDPNEDANKLLVNNYEQTAFDKIDDEMFNNIRTRCLKSCPIKRFFEENHFTENLDSEQHTANKQCKTDKVSAREKVVSSDNINFQDSFTHSSVSASSFSDSQPGEVTLSARQENVSSEQIASKILLHQNSTLVQETILESEEMPFEEPKTDVSTQMAEACCSDCETSFLQQGTDLSQKNSFESNYINERLNHGRHKQMLVADDDQTEGWCQKYKTVSIQSSCSEENSNSSSKSVPLFFKLQANEKLPTKQKVCDKSKDSSFGLPSGKNVPSMFRSYKRSLKELAPVRMSQSTRSILDQFRAPQHKRETTESAVQRIKPDIKTLHCQEKRSCINLDLEKSPVKAIDSEEDICSKEQQIPLRNHQLEVKVRPRCETLSVQESEMLKKLLAQKSSRNSIASKLSKLYKNDGKKSCSPSKNEMLLTTISAGQNEKYKSDEENRTESSQSHLENQKINQDLSNLNPKTEMYYVKDSRKTEIEEGFTSLQEYSDSIAKSVPSLELANPLLNFGSVVNKINNPEALVFRHNLERSEKLVGKKRQFLCSSAFLQTLGSINPQTTKREANQEKESHIKSSKNFDSGRVQYFSRDRHDEYNHFGSSRNCHRTSHYQMHGNICLSSCSKDGTDRDFCDNLSKSTLLSKNKTLSYQPCSDQNKNIFSEEFSTESLQLAQSISMNISVEKPILSLDFSSDKDSASPQNLQDTASKISFEQDISNSNFDEGTQVCKWKQNNDTTSLAITTREISLETAKSCSFVETQGNMTEPEEKILKKRDQIIPSPVSDLYFDKEKMVTDGECVFGNRTVVYDVSVGKTDETTGKKHSAFHSYSASLTWPTASSSYEGKKCTQYSQEQRPNQQSSNTCEYLDEAPKILSDASKMLSKNPEISSKSFKTLAKTSEVSSDCPQISSKTCEMLSDTSEKLEICQISNETSETTNHTPETLNEISGTFRDTHKTLSDTFEVSNDILKSLIHSPVTSSNAHKIICNTSEATISTSKMSRNTQNSQLPNNQCNQCNTVSFEATTDQSDLVPDMSSLPNGEPAVKLGLIVHKNSSPTSSTLLSTKLSSPLLLEASTHKTNPQRDISVSARQDFPLRKTDDAAPFLIKQAQRQCLLFHRSPSASSDPESTVKDLIRISHCEDLESDKSSQQLEAECVPKTLSQELVMKFQHSRNSLIHTETDIQQVSPSFSKEVDVEKSSETSNLTLKNSSDTKQLKTLVLPESSAFSKLEELSHDLASFETSVGVCMDSHNIQLMKNVDHLENSEAMLLQDLVPANETLFQPGTSTTFDLDLNKGQPSNKKLFESNLKPNENLEMECTQNPYVKTYESYLQKLDVGSGNDDDDDDDEEESEQNITDETETDLTLKLWRNWKNPIFQMGETDVLDIWTNHSVQRKLHRVTHSCQFTKAMLSQMETIGQVDNKFIACIVKSQDERSGIPDHLLMIDQHAAHERVRLEQLTADMYQSENSEESEKLAVKFSRIFPPWTLSLSDKEMRIVSSFLDEFSKIGLQLKVHQEGNTIEIHTAPSCIMTREASERRHNRNTVAIDLVQALIKEKIELLHDTRGAHSTLPKTIHNLLCSQACHGAIKFNDPLTLVECQNLLKMLLKCKLPFQCAHGRPSVIPLLNLQHLKRILTKPEPPKINLKKLQRQMGEQEKMNS